MLLPAPRTHARFFSALVAVGLSCASGLAYGQSDPPAAPAPGEPAAPSPEPWPEPLPEPASSPPAAPSAEGFQASFGGPASTADAASSPPPPPTPGEPKPLPWRGTTFAFNQSATTTALGVGRDNVGGENEYYGWDLTLVPNFYVLDEARHKVTVFAEAGFAVEWTNSSVTTTEHEPYFKDLQVGAEYRPTFFVSDDAEYVTGGALRARLVFPTSPISQGQGRILGTSLGGSVQQRVKLLGVDARGLNGLNLRAGLTWSHLFAESYNPTNPDLHLRRQNARGQSIESDQLTTTSFDVDRLVPSAGFDLDLIGDLSWSTTMRLIGRFKHDFGADTSDCVETATGPACAETDPTRTTYVTNTSFDTSLGYSIFGLVDVNLGYNNETLGLAPDGTRRTVFYSPDAQFYVDFIANLDVIYDRATGRAAPAKVWSTASGALAPVGPAF